MKSNRNWRSEARVALLLCFSAGVLGSLTGFAGELIALTLAGLLLHTLRQLRRLDKWLKEPEQEPPESVGFWGSIFDEIYTLRRRDKEAQARLESVVNYLRDSLASIRDGAVLINSNGKVEWSNGAAERLLGLQYPQDGGQNLLNLVRIPAISDYFQDGDYSEPLVVQLDSNSETHLEVEISLFGEGDRLMFVRDVTAKVRLDQMRRDFVGNVSHELRTPLTVITGYLSTLASLPDEASPKFQKPLAQMQQQAQRMEDLLKDLLWLSRIESVRDQRKQELVDLRVLLEDLKEELADIYPGRVIETLIDDQARISGDNRELYSAVSNLVLNALKYSGADSPIRVTWRATKAGAELAVLDYGPGIEAIHLSRLTERFYRVDSGRATSQGGTGLGLAIVKHVVASHRAELKIESELGQGSCFTIIFPIEVIVQDLPETISPE